MREENWTLVMFGLFDCVLAALRWAPLWVVTLAGAAYLYAWWRSAKCLWAIWKES